MNKWVVYSSDYFTFLYLAPPRFPVFTETCSSLPPHSLDRRSRFIWCLIYRAHCIYALCIHRQLHCTPPPGRSLPVASCDVWCSRCRLFHALPKEKERAENNIVLQAEDLCWTAKRLSGFSATGIHSTVGHRERESAVHTHTHRDTFQKRTCIATETVHLSSPQVLSFSSDST